MPERDELRTSEGWLSADGMRTVAVDGEQALVCRVGERVFVVGARCPHRGAPLEAGSLDGAVLSCPWHGASFDVRTGDRVRGPECPGIARYEAEWRDGQLVISAASPDGADGG